MPKVEISPGRKIRDRSSCTCCPYGFHIDRDFVRYCESLYNNTQLDKLKQKKKDRRREYRTVESYLGLEGREAVDVNHVNSVYADLSHQRKAVKYFPPHDGLDSAVTDFENTWQNSLKRKSAANEKNTSERIRKESASSENGFLSSNVEIDRNVLAHIREQMATSLNHVKELEAQVKCIPELQVKLTTLKEENKLLLCKLKTQNQLTPNKSSLSFSTDDIKRHIKKLDNVSVIAPELTQKHLEHNHLVSSSDTLTSPAIASHVNMTLAKRHFIDSKILSELNIDKNLCMNGDLNFKLPKKNCKNVATSCSVLTRDVGVGHLPHKYKSMGVGESNVYEHITCIHCNQYKNLKCSTSISSESLGSDSDSVDDSVNHLHSNASTLQYERDKILESKSLNLFPRTKTWYEQQVFRPILQPNFKHESTLTDLLSTDIVLKKEIDRKLQRNKSTFCGFPEKSVKEIQVSLKHEVKDACTLYDICTYSHIGIQVGSINLYGSGVELHNGKHVSVKHSIKKCDIGVGSGVISDTTSNWYCSKCCSIQTKNVGVGDAFVSDNNEIMKKLVSIGCGDTPVYEHFGDQYNLKKVRTVGVGDYDVKQTDCEKCKASKKPAVRSVGTYTSTDILSNVNMTDSNSDIQICDKCSATIKSVAHDLAARTSKLEEIPKFSSQIPRLNQSSPTVKSAATSKIIESLESQQSSFSKISEMSLSNENNICSPKTSSHSLLQEDKKFSEESISIKEETCIKASEEVNTDQFGSSESIEINPFNVIPREKVKLNKEIKGACKVLNDCLRKPERGSEKTISTSLNIIQKEWFHIANQKNADPHVIEDYLDVFEEFSKLLLHRIVNLSDNNGNTAIHYAVSYGNFDVVSILLDSKVCDVNKRNKAGYTCIMLVALAEVKCDAHHFVVRRLFNMGDINIKAKQNGQTALMLAASRGKTEIVKILIDAGAEINLQDNDGSTALMCAAENGHIDVVKVLLTNPECDPSVVDMDGSSALSIAMEAEHKDIGLLIYASINFSRGSSPYSSLKRKRRSTPRSTPPPRTPTMRTPPPPSPSARSTCSLPSTFHFVNYEKQSMD